MRNFKLFWKLFIYILILSFILAFILLRYFSKGYDKSLRKYTNEFVRKIVIAVINNSIRDIDYRDYNIVVDNDFDISKIMDIEKDLCLSIDKNIKYVEEGKLEKVSISLDGFKGIDSYKIKNGFLYTFSFGNVLGNTFLSNIGPAIPLKFRASGGSMCHVKSNIKEYGINNALVEIDMEVRVAMMVVIPLMSDRIVVKKKIPLFIKLVEGEVPSYYNGYIGND